MHLPREFRPCLNPVRPPEQLCDRSSPPHQPRLATGDVLGADQAQAHTVEIESAVAWSIIIEATPPSVGRKRPRWRPW
jgi:hypothetical protein